MELTKIQIKVKLSTGYLWSHFCYVPKDTKDLFDKEVNTEGNPSNYWIKKWLEEDFDVEELVDVDNITLKDLDAYKSLIKDTYKDKYPELYMESSTDNQGWLRLWYKNHMEKELSEHEQPQGQSE